jgi:hypothetical protein
VAVTGSHAATERAPNLKPRQLAAGFGFWLRRGYGRGPGGLPPIFQKKTLVLVFEARCCAPAWGAFQIMRDPVSSRSIVESSESTSAFCQHHPSTNDLGTNDHTTRERGNETLALAQRMKRPIFVKRAPFIAVAGQFAGLQEELKRPRHE